MKSIEAFYDRKLHLLDREAWEKCQHYVLVDYKDKVYDDDKYDWQMVHLRLANDHKYGRIMVSHDYKLRRGLTMGEFYGTGEVD